MYDEKQDGCGFWVVLFIGLWLGGFVCGIAVERGREGK